MDDDAFLGSQGSIGVGASGTAQNWLNLRGERALSTNDQRHLMNATLQYTTGMGIGGRTLLSGWRGLAYKEWTIVTNINVGSGLPETPIYISSLGGVACQTCIRPDYVPGQPISKNSNGKFLNPAAFVAARRANSAMREGTRLPGPTSFP